MRPITIPNLERMLRKALPKATIKIEKLGEATAADAEYDSERARIRVDRHKVGLRTAVIHELLHFCLDDKFQDFDGEIGECFIEALETAVDKYVAASRGRARWWREAIEAKLTKRR